MVPQSVLLLCTPRFQRGRERDSGNGIYQSEVTFERLLRKLSERITDRGPFADEISVFLKLFRMVYRVFTDDKFDCQLETIFQGNEGFSAVIVDDSFSSAVHLSLISPVSQCSRL